MKNKNASNRSASVNGFVTGIILAVLGLPLLNPVLLVIGIVLIVQNKGAVGKQAKRPVPYKSAYPKPPADAARPAQPRPAGPAQPVQPARRRTESASYHSFARDHYHITNAALSVEKRLEQLEVMRNAGLLDREEYQQRLQKILNDR